MFTSDTNVKDINARGASARNVNTSDGSKSLNSIWITYLAVSVFCVIFALVYEHFSHGVYSAYMMSAFLWPLVLGALPHFIISITRRSAGRPAILPSRLVKNLQGSAVATLTVGSVLSGVLEIYGTTNSLTVVYWVAGFVLLLASIVTYFLKV